MDSVVLCDSHSHPPQLADVCAFVSGMAIPCNSSAKGARDTFGLQHTYEPLSYVNIQRTTASPAPLIGCVLPAFRLASAIGADSERIDDRCMLQRAPTTQHYVVGKPGRASHCRTYLHRRGN